MAALRATNTCMTCVRRLNLYKITSHGTNSSSCCINLRNIGNVNQLNITNAAFSSRTLRTCRTHQNDATQASATEEIRGTEVKHGEPKNKRNSVSDQNLVSSRSRQLTDYEEYQHSKQAEEQRERSYTEMGAVDYSYFKSVIKATKAVDMNPLKGAVPIDPRQYRHEGYDNGAAEEENTEMTNKGKLGKISEPQIDSMQLKQDNEEISDASATVEPDSILTVTESKRLTKPKVRGKVYGLKNIKPKLPAKSYTVAPYVNECEVLKNLLSLGVELPMVEKNRKASNFLLKCDWEKDIQPYMVFLHELGVPDSALGRIFSKFPSIFLTDFHDLEERVQYLLSKKFPDTEIPYLIKRMPTILNLDFKDLDANLGYLQKEFKLTGNEVREAVLRYPKIVVFDKREVQLRKAHFQEVFEFSHDEVKNIFVQVPRVFTNHLYATHRTFDYLVNKMGITREFIAKEYPRILDTRESILKQRHGFLAHIRRAQYDPTKENYIFLKNMVKGTDFDFCKDVAKVSVRSFRDYLKTL